MINYLKAIVNMIIFSFFVNELANADFQIEFKILKENLLNISFFQIYIINIRYIALNSDVY
jgi:hypothetical protein